MKRMILYRRNINDQRWIKYTQKEKKNNVDCLVLQPHAVRLPIVGLSLKHDTRALGSVQRKRKYYVKKNASPLL